MNPFRVTVGFPGQIANVTWLHNLLASTIGRFTDPEISITYPLSGGYLGVFADCGLPSELKGWASLFWKEPPRWLVDKIQRESSRTLIAGTELPPIMTRALDLAGIKWVEINVSPIRFFPDWVLHFKAAPLIKLGRLAPLALEKVDMQNATK